jgi:hypothetical protein
MQPRQDLVLLFRTLPFLRDEIPSVAKEFQVDRFVTLSDDPQQREPLCHLGSTGLVLHRHPDPIQPLRRKPSPSPLIDFARVHGRALRCGGHYSWLLAARVMTGVAQ